MGLDDFLDIANLFDKCIDRPLGWLMSAIPHRHTRKGRPVGDLVVDPGLWEIRIVRGNETSQTGGDMERRLAEVGVRICGRRVRDDEFICYVRTRQAKWAEQVLLRAGIVFSPLYRWYDQRTPMWAGRHLGPVRTWASRKRGNHGN